VCGVRGCCWNKSASFCIRIFGIHCLHLHLHITATQNSDAEMRRRYLGTQASKHPPPPPPKEARRKKCTYAQKTSGKRTTSKQFVL
jgi:hypothetical protein